MNWNNKTYHILKYVDIKTCHG